MRSDLTSQFRRNQLSIHHLSVPRRVPHCEMNGKFASKLLLLACLTGSSELGAGIRPQVVEQTKPPVVFMTAPKLIGANLKFADGSSSIVRGRATLTAVKANEDDSLTGTLVYLLPDEARQKLAQASKRNLAEIPQNITQKDLTVNFERGTACPLVRLQVPVKETTIGNVTLHFDHVMLDIHETPDQINQLFCNWTRQINAKRQRLGIIAAINRLITPEEDVENKTAKP